MPILNGRYVSPTWINNQAPPINALELQAITDTLEGLNGIGGNGRGYVVVGTAQSGATLSTCDYLCDGTADEVEINQAIQKASEIGMDIFLLNGTYTLSNPISALPNIMIVGQIYGLNLQDNLYFPNMVTIVASSSTLSALINMENITDNTLRLFGIQLGSSLASDPQSLINYGSYTGILELENVNMYTVSGKGISQPSNDFELYAQNSTLVSSTLSLVKSHIEQCILSGISFTECGALAQGTDNFFRFNTFTSDVTMTDCQKCTLIGNIFYGSLSLQSGSATNSVCVCNNIMGNTFAAGNGITLGTGTSYNNVTCNGGVAYQGGTSFTHWSGVTDNGTNNYVSNNMPTS